MEVEGEGHGKVAEIKLERPFTEPLDIPTCHSLSLCFVKLLHKRFIPKSNAAKMCNSHCLLGSRVNMRGLQTAYNAMPSVPRTTSTV